MKIIEPSAGKKAMSENLLSNREKFWYLVGPVTVSLVFAATRPIIQIYFVSHIDPQVLAMANLLETGLAAIVNYTIQFERLKELYRKYFFWIVATDILIFSATSLIGVDYPAVRFFGFSILNAVSTCLWFMIMQNIANRIIVDGDERTNFDALNQSTCLAASFIGGVFAVIFVNISVEICVMAQCLANAFMGITDLYSFKILKRAYEEQTK